jgi:hypothetical protein
MPNPNILMPIYSAPVTYITSTNDVLCNIVIDKTHLYTIAEKIYTIITKVISLFIRY